MSGKQDVVFYCWRCGQKLAVPDTYQGKNLSCPQCRRQLTVPAGDGVVKRDVSLAQQAEDELDVTEADMTFTCRHCDWVIIVDKRGAGMTFPCPGCGTLVVAPPAPDAPPADDAPPEGLLGEVSA